MLRLGYPCLNLTLGATTSHTLRLANVRDTQKLREVVRSNLSDLERILEWNAAHGVAVFRLGSQLIPFASHPHFPYDLAREHGPQLREIGKRARALGQRLSFHPGQYTNPGSPCAATACASIAELEYNATVLDLLGGEDPVIVLHMGGAYGDKRTALAAFVRSLRRQERILRHLALENDERIWTVAEVREAAGVLGVPVIVDTLHHRLNPGGMTLAEALTLALPTWGRRRPKIHISSQDSAKMAGAHAGFIDTRDWRTLQSHIEGRCVDVMIEAKEKERAVLRLLAATQARLRRRDSQQKGQRF